MKTNLYYYYYSIIVYDLTTKLPKLINRFQIPEFLKIHLNIGLKTITSEKQKIIYMITLLKIITNKNPILTKSKKNNIFLKIKKNSIIGCKINLTKKNIYIFLEKLIFLNHFFIKFTKKTQQSLTFQIKNKDLLNFIELKQEFYTFQNLPPIDVTIQNNNPNHNEFLLLLKLFLSKKIK